MFHRVLNTAVTTKTYIELPQKALMSPATKHESVTGFLWGLWNMKKQKNKYEKIFHAEKQEFFWLPWIFRSWVIC